MNGAMSLVPQDLETLCIVAVSYEYIVCMLGCNNVLQTVYIMDSQVTGQASPRTLDFCVGCNENLGFSRKLQWRASHALMLYFIGSMGKI